MLEQFRQLHRLLIGPVLAALEQAPPRVLESRFITVAAHAPTSRRTYPNDVASAAYKDFNEVLRSVTTAGLARQVARLKANGWRPVEVRS